MLLRRTGHAALVAGRTVIMNSARAIVALGIVSTVLWTSGCYSYVAAAPSDIAPPVSVSASLNDVGRVAVGTRVGPEVAAIDGRVVERSDSAVSMMVTDVHYLNGLSSEWQGQQVNLRYIDFKSISRRTFSRSRTALLLGALAAGLVISIAGLNFLGVISGDPSNDKGGGGPTPDS